MANIKEDLKYSGIEQTQIQEYEKDIIRIHEGFYLKEKIDSEFLGWLSLPTNYNREEFSRIKKAAPIGPDKPVHPDDSSSADDGSSSDAGSESVSLPNTGNPLAILLLCILSVIFAGSRKRKL